MRFVSTQASGGREPPPCDGRAGDVRTTGPAFRFLHDRAPKESILGRFDLTVIAPYFPKFEPELRRYLLWS